MAVVVMVVSDYDGCGGIIAYALVGRAFLRG